MEKLFIPAEHGQLEIIVEKIADSKGVGIMCHPHSLHGGSMDNKVVMTVAKAWQALGLTTIRFNFRGVGRSSGVFHEGEGEQEDLQHVIDWAQKKLLLKPLYLAGFSFGAYVALRFCQHFTPDHLLLIAPPAQYPHFDSLKLPNCPTDLIVAAEDDVVVTADILGWAQNQPFRRILNIPDATHFFHGKLLLLKAFILEDHL